MTILLNLRENTPPHFFSRATFRELLISLIIIIVVMIRLHFREENGFFFHSHLVPLISRMDFQKERRKEGYDNASR